MPPRLPGLNYGTPLTIDDLSYLESIYTSEFRNRTLASIGNYRATGPQYGIVASSDPVNAVVTTDPLYVERNANDVMTVNVYPGVCFTESGMRVELTTQVTQLTMALTTVGSQNVLYVEHIVESDPDTITKTRYNTNEARRTKVADETSTDPTAQTVLQVVSLATWQDDTTYPPDRRANIVVLAIVSVAAADNPGGQQVVVDLTRNNITVNRPWFSPVDMEHRSLIGTGSADTPHRLGLNDLSQGDLTLYDQLVNHGMVVGRDRDAPGVPGSLCLETITPAQLQIDTTGTVTGTVSQAYVELTRYPVRLLGAYGLSDQTNEILVQMLPKSNIVLLSLDDAIPTGGMRLLYTTVQAGEPLADSLVNDEFHVRQPNTAYELLVSGGSGHSIIQPRFLDQFTNERARLSLGTAPAIPKHYRIVLDQDGALLALPQHLLCATRLEDLGTAVFQFETTMLGAARLRVGLQNTTLVGATDVQLRLTGNDSAGNTVTEDVAFTYASYTDPVVGNCYETSTNWVVTDTVLSSATSLQVVSRTSDGPNTAVSVMAELNPMQSEVIRDLCPIANVMWDGARICRIQDARQIGTRVAVPSRTTPVQLAAQSTLAGFAATDADAMELLSEDLRDPHWFRLDDPLRYWKFNDGLESADLPMQPGVESASAGLQQDRYVSRAVRLIAGTDRNVLVTLFGYSAQRYWLNDADGTLPNLEYRWSTTPAPDTWTPWAAATPLADTNGANFRIAITDNSAFNFQLRVKGSVVGVSAIQYRQIDNTKFSGIRQYNGATITSAQTHQVELPFGRTLTSTDYQINVTVYEASGTGLSAGAAGLDVIHVDKQLDHAVVHLTSSAATLSVDWRIDWSVDLQRYEATAAEIGSDVIVEGETMSQRRFVNFGADANASTVKTINSMLAAPQVLRATAPFFQAAAPDQLVIRPHSVIFESGMLLDEDEQQTVTIPTEYNAADYTVLYRHVDEDIIGGTAATLELEGGLLSDVANTVILGWVRYPGSSVQIDTSMLFPNRIGQLRPERLTRETAASAQQVIVQDSNVTITASPNALAGNVPASPYEVSLGTVHVSRLLPYSDQKVRVYCHTNSVEMTRISSGVPATGEFILNSSTGVMTFAALDTGNVIDIADITYGAGYRLAVNGSATLSALTDTLYSFSTTDDPIRAITVDYIPLGNNYAVSVVEALDVNGDAITVDSVSSTPATADGTAARLVVRLLDGVVTGTDGEYLTVRLRETMPPTTSGLLLRVRATNYDLPF